MMAINAASAQNKEQLAQKLATQLCENMSMQLDSIKTIKRYFEVIEKTDNDFFGELATTSDFDNLARLISDDSEPQLNPYARAIELIIETQQRNCPFFEKYWKLDKPITKSVSLIGDSTCRCMVQSLTARERGYTLPETYLNYYQSCGIGAIKFPVYTFQIRNDFDLVKNPTSFDSQLVAYTFTKCDAMVKAFTLGRASSLRSIKPFDMWLKASNIIVENVRNPAISDSLKKYFVNKKAFKQSFDVLVKGQKILPKELGYSQTFVKTQDLFIHTVTYHSWKTNKVVGQFKIEYDKNGFGKIKNIVFLEPNDIPNVKEFDAELAKYPPPPPPPPPVEKN
jgi:hypothetical protein